MTTDDMLDPMVAGIARLTPTQIARFLSLAATDRARAARDLGRALSEALGAPVGVRKAREYLERLEKRDPQTTAGNGFEQYRQAAEKLIAETPAPTVTPLQELAAEIDACAGAARMLAH